MKNDKKKYGFAAMDAERLRQIASAGGIARGEMYKQARQKKREKSMDMQAAPSPASQIILTANPVRISTTC